MMIAPMIHKLLRREDLLRLVDEIAATDPRAAYPAARQLEAGRVDALLDSRVALDAVRGRGGAPAALPLTLLWYIPVRAALRERGERDIALADYTATLPLAFVAAGATKRVAKGEGTLAAWTRAIRSFPHNTVAQGEHAAYCGALAIWWTGIFPEWVTRRAQGRGIIRAYLDFAAGALDLAAQSLRGVAPHPAALYAAAARRAGVLRDVLYDVGRDYVGRDAHSAEGRLHRYLSRLQPSEPEQDHHTS
jgi:hypothetical protein